MANCSGTPLGDLPPFDAEDCSCDSPSDTIGKLGSAKLGSVIGSDSSSVGSSSGNNQLTKVIEDLKRSIDNLGKSISGGKGSAVGNNRPTNYDLSSYGGVLSSNRVKGHLGSLSSFVAAKDMSKEFLQNQIKSPLSSMKPSFLDKVVNSTTSGQFSGIIARGSLRDLNAINRIGSSSDVNKALGMIGGIDENNIQESTSKIGKELENFANSLKKNTMGVNKALIAAGTTLAGGIASAGTGIVKANYSYGTSLLDTKTGGVVDMMQRQANRDTQINAAIGGGLLGGIGGAIGGVAGSIVGPLGAAGGVAIGGAIGNDLGRMFSSRYSATSNMKYLSRESEIMSGHYLTAQGNKNIRSAFGSSPEELQRYSNYTNVGMGLFQNKAQANDFAFAMGKSGKSGVLQSMMNNPLMSADQMVASMPSMLNAMRTGDLNLKQFTSGLGGMTGSSVAQGMNDLAYSPNRRMFGGSQSLEAMSVHMNKLKVSNPMLANTYADYQNMGYSKHLMLNAMSQSVYGISADHLLNDKGDKRKHEVDQAKLHAEKLFGKNAGGIIKDLGGTDLLSLMSKTSHKNESVTGLLGDMKKELQTISAKMSSEKTMSAKLQDARTSVEMDKKAHLGTPTASATSLLERASLSYFGIGSPSQKLPGLYSGIDERKQAQFIKKHGGKKL